MKREDILRIFVALPLILFVAVGLAAAGGQGGFRAYGFPVYVLAVALAFVLQWLAFIPAYLFKTEKFYDLTGSITYLAVTGLALILSPSPDARAGLLAAMVTVWALRLGSFLFLRIRSAGEDRRFRDIKRSFSRFLIAWTLQGLWVAFSLAAVLAAITSQVRLELGAFALAGFLIWVFGFAIEIIADRQKSRFNAEAQNKGKFIQSGLWAWSRHPNYFGEIVLWIGVLVIAAPVLRGWQWVALISPVFITLLLTRISGIPMLESRADEKWGGQEDYEAYKARTPILIPRPPARKNDR